MIPNRHAMVGARQLSVPGLVAALVGSAGAPIAWPTAAQPGYLAVLIKYGSAPPAPWSAIIGPGNKTPGVYSVSLAPSDLIAPLAPDQNYNCLIYRGARSIELRASISTQGPPGSFTNVMGFTKSANCAGRLALAACGLAYSIPTLSTLPGITGHANGSGHWNVLGDLDPSFVSGSGVNVTWNTSDPSGPGWAMLELLK